MTAPPLPPWTTDAVVAWLLGPGMRSCVDVEGRPLGEHASPLYDHVPRREERRTFGDARDASGLPCNVAALGQLHATWFTLLAALAGLDAEQPDTLARTLGRVSAGLRLGPLQGVRTRAPIPVVSAALHKAMLGFGDLCAAMLLEVRADADQPAPGGDVLQDWLGERPWLIGQVQVCAGSRAQITRCWQALRESTPHASEREPPIPELHAPWFRAALGAQLELEALAAASAGFVRVARARKLPVGPIGLALFESGEVPLWAEALRQVPGAGPAHPSLLFASERVPASLRAFVNAVSAEGLVDADAALLAAAADPAQRLMHALGVAHPSPLTDAAFRDSCGPGAPLVATRG